MVDDDRGEDDVTHAVDDSCENDLKSVEWGWRSE